MKILQKIIAHKRQELKQQKLLVPLSSLAKKRPLPARDFRGSITRHETISIIGEIKKRSPSGGQLINDLNPATIARQYEKNRIQAISVLTDQKFFGGNPAHLRAVKNATNLPVLRKDFIIDDYQVHESYALGADAILLIARVLDESELTHFITLAKELGLVCLVEIHTKQDLNKALNCGVEILGVNNRDLDNLEVDITTALKLRPQIPDDHITVCESGIRSREHVLMMQQAGYDAVLIGETLMRAENIEAKIRELL